MYLSIASRYFSRKELAKEELKIMHEQCSCTTEISVWVKLILYLCSCPGRQTLLLMLHAWSITRYCETIGMLLAQVHPQYWPQWSRSSWHIILVQWHSDHLYHWNVALTFRAILYAQILKLPKLKTTATMTLNLCIINHSNVTTC